MTWYVYNFLCSDGTFYVGHTADLDSRIHAHNIGKGSHYTASRRPVKLVYHEMFPSEAGAIRRERQLKRWSHAKKKALVEGKLADLRRLSQSRD